MAKTIVHVNQHHIKFNSKHGNLKPVLTVKQGNKNIYTNEVTINGPSQVIYSPENPLACGARVWISTEAEVIITNPMTFQETKQICEISNGQAT